MRNFLARILIGDETWVNYDNSETKKSELVGEYFDNAVETYRKNMKKILRN